MSTKIYEAVKNSIVDRWIPLCKDEWISYLEEWKLHFEDGDGDYVDRIIESLKCEDWQGFKNGLVKYLEDQGYKNTSTYTKFCELSTDYIAGCFKFRRLFCDCSDDFIHKTYEDNHNDDVYDLYNNGRTYLFMAGYYEDLMDDEEDDPGKINFWVEDSNNNIVLDKYMVK